MYPPHRYAVASPCDAIAVSYTHLSQAAFVLKQEKNRPILSLSLYRIPRNQIITVSYDGKIVRDKFKRLEADLNSGRCVIISE